MISYVLIVGLCIGGVSEETCQPVMSIHNPSAPTPFEECMQMGETFVAELNKEVKEGEKFAFQCIPANEVKEENQL